MASKAMSIATGLVVSADKVESNCIAVRLFIDIIENIEIKFFVVENSANDKANT